MALVDYTTFTEVDTPGVFSVASSAITATDCDQDIDAYVYKDYGADYFNAIDHEFDARLLNTSDNSAAFAPWAVTVNTVGEMYDIATTDCFIWFKEFAGEYQVFLMRGAGGGSALDFYSAGTYLNERLYFTIARTADSDTIVCTFYTDSGRTNLVDTLTVAGYGTSTKYRYLYGISSGNNGNAGRNADGDASNLDDGIAASSGPANPAPTLSLLGVG